MEKVVNAHPGEFMSTSDTNLTSSGLSLSPAELTEKALRLIQPCSGHLTFPIYFPDGCTHTPVVQMRGFTGL